MAKDRDRLKDVHTTDLTESKVNEDFVDWIKTQGPTYLLILVIALLAFVMYHRVKGGRVQKEADAWLALSESTLPDSLVEVGNEYDDVGSIDMLSWLTAAKVYVRTVQTGMTIQALTNRTSFNQPVAPEDRLDEETRTRHLDLAEGLFEDVLTRAANENEEDVTILVVGAMSGLGAVAECRGDIDKARQQYEQAASRAETRYPLIAKHLRGQAESTGQYVETVVMPEENPIVAPAYISGRSPDALDLDPALEEIIEPSDNGDG